MAPAPSSSRSFILLLCRLERHPFTALALSTPSYLLFLAMALLRFLLSPAPPLLLRLLLRSHSFVFSLAFLVQCAARLPFLLAALRRFYKRSKPFHRRETLLLFLRGYLIHRKSFPFFRCFVRFVKLSKKRQGVVFIVRGVLKHRKAFAYFLRGFCKYPKAFLNLYRTRKDVKKVRRSLLLLCSAARRQHGSSLCFLVLLLVVLAAQRSQLLPGNISFPLSLVGLKSSH